MSGAIVPPLNTEDIAIKSYDLGVNKYYALGHTVSFLYDHALTFGSEVECVWKRRFTLPTYLFLIFRYVTPLVCIINIVAENDPTWVGIRCSHWVWLPVALGPMIYATTGFILILRTHALYNRAYWVLYIAVPVYLAQISISLWTIPVGVPEPLPTGLIGCIPSEKLGTNARLIASYVASVVFDACIFILTIVRAMQLRNQRDHMALVSIIARDGAMYFFALFLLNLFNIFLLHMAIPELSGPNARFSSLITAALVARLTLNLRAASGRTVTTSVSSDDFTGPQLTTIADLVNFKWIMTAHGAKEGADTFAENVLGLSDFDAPLEGSESIDDFEGGIGKTRERELE